MGGSVTTRGALLQALRQGPGYGRELVRRVARLSGGRLHLSEARVYPTLKAMSTAGLVRTSRSSPGGIRGGRERIYYGLTVRGVELSSVVAGILHGLLGSGEGFRMPDARERARMAARLVEAEALSKAAGELEQAMERTVRG